MIRAMQVYKEVGYDGMMMPDHLPHIAGDAGGRQAFAYAFGYIRALIQMMGGQGLKLLVPQGSHGIDS